MKLEMYDFHKPEQEENWWFKARKNIVNKTLKKYLPKKENNIIEIGCGYGIMTKMLASYGAITGIEPYTDCYDYLKANIKGTFAKEEFLKFETEKKFDVVALFDVLEHIEDETAAVQKIHSLLEQNGRVVLTVPAYMFLWSTHDDLNKHFRRYTLTELKELFKINGFRINKLTYFNTFLFPIAYLHKITQNKETKPYHPGRLLNNILYFFFNLESGIIPCANLSFGVSLLLIAEKNGKSE